MCVTCGCGGKSATYEEIDKHSNKTTKEKESKQEREAHVHHKKENTEKS